MRLSWSGLPALRFETQRYEAVALLLRARRVSRFGYVCSVGTVLSPPLALRDT